jgi:hypothetical protein
MPAHCAHTKKDRMSYFDELEELIDPSFRLCDSDDVAAPRVKRKFTDDILRSSTEDMDDFILNIKKSDPTQKPYDAEEQTRQSVTTVSAPPIVAVSPPPKQSTPQLTYATPIRPKFLGCRRCNSTHFLVSIRTCSQDSKLSTYAICVQCSTSECVTCLEHEESQKQTERERNILLRTGKPALSFKCLGCNQMFQYPGVMRQHWVSTKHLLRIRKYCDVRKYCSLSCATGKREWVTREEQRSARVPSTPSVPKDSACHLCGGLFE